MLLHAVDIVPASAASLHKHVNRLKWNLLSCHQHSRGIKNAMTATEAVVQMEIEKVFHLLIAVVSSLCLGYAVIPEGWRPHYTAYSAI